jgi:hypothetical protein
MTAPSGARGRQLEHQGQGGAHEHNGRIIATHRTDPERDP